MKKDRVGEKWNRLTIIGFDKTTITKGNNKVNYWWCRCECGNVKSICYNSLLGKTKSCGCLNKENLQNKYIDRTGEVYNYYTIISFDKRHKDQIFWNCQCKCGEIKSIPYNSLSSGNTKSCGCLQKELLKERMTTHGYTGSSEYSTWQHMVGRCNNPKEAGYEMYGEVGITVCNEWLKFENFIKDMGDKPTAEHTIDRIDGTKGYYKENCRWASKIEQNNNLKSNRIVIDTLTNKEYSSINVAARDIGMVENTLYNQLTGRRKNKTNLKLK